MSKETKAEIEVDLDFDKIGAYALGTAFNLMVANYDDNFGVTRAKHCYREVMANIDDPKWSSQSFIDCIPKLEQATSRSGINAHKIFLSCLIEDIIQMEVLPADLIKELVIYYKWPSSPFELNEGTSEIDPLIKELLNKLAVQNDIRKKEKFVDKIYQKKVKRRDLVLWIGAFIVALIYLGFKYWIATV